MFKLDRKNAIVLLVNVVVGFLFAALVSAFAGPNVILVVIIIAVALWFLTVSGKEDNSVAFAVFGVIIGIVLGLFVEPLGWQNLGGDNLTLSFALLFFVLHA